MHTEQLAGLTALQHCRRALRHLLEEPDAGVCFMLLLLLMPCLLLVLLAVLLALLVFLALLVLAILLSLLGTRLWRLCRRCVSRSQPVAERALKASL
jgi:hypothetical protein